MRCNRLVFNRLRRWFKFSLPQGPIPIGESLPVWQNRGLRSWIVGSQLDIVRGSAEAKSLSPER